MEFWDVIQSRKSIRSFMSDKVPYADIQKIVSAAIMATTVNNDPILKFVAIQNPKHLGKLAEIVEDRLRAALMKKHGMNVDDMQTIEQVISLSGIFEKLMF